MLTIIFLQKNLKTLVKTKINRINYYLEAEAIKGSLFDSF